MLAFAAILFAGLACAFEDALHVAPPMTTTRAATPGEVGVSELKAAVEAGAFVIDVRTDREFAGGRVPGALNIPVDQLGRRISEVEPHKGSPVYLICATGNRSGRAALALAGQGYEAFNVVGGTSAWVRAGYPVEQ